jgi:hypothetical protein
MNDAGFIVGSYVVTVVAIAAYAAALVRRARRLGGSVRQEERPWE